MDGFTDQLANSGCVNPESFGEICVKCGKCGRATKGISDETHEKIREAIESMELTDEIAKSVCEHFWYAGNQLIGNGELDRFICRKHLEKYGRTDECLMVIPYTNAELKVCLEKFCDSHFEGCREEMIRRDHHLCFLEGGST